MIFATRLFVLLAGHALGDYPLQGGFLARGKNHRDPILGVPWYQCLLAHALIHGAIVYVGTGSIELGAAEFILHAAIDYAKCDGRLTFNQDQALHAAAKLVWAWLA